MTGGGKLKSAIYRPGQPTKKNATQHDAERLPCEKPKYNLVFTPDCGITYAIPLEAISPPADGNSVAYIQEHYTEEIALEQLAQMAGSSVSHFVRIFTKTLEMSPNRFIVTTRINAARKLLETTDMLISDIAHETGFYDQSHMTRAFKAFRKTTPGEYRRNHRSISSP